MKINNKFIKRKRFKGFRYSFLLLALLPFFEICWKSGGNSFAFIGYIFLPIVFLLFAYNAFYYITLNHLKNLMTTNHFNRVRLYFILLSILVLYGLLRGNVLNVTLSQAFIFFSFGIFLLLGVDDKICDLVFNIATVSVWLAAFCALFTLNIHSYIPSWDPFAGEDMRFRDTLAFEFHPFFSLCLPLFLLGWIKPKSSRSYFQMAAILPFLFFEVLTFKNRGALFASAMVFIAALMMPTTSKKKLKLVIFVVVLFCGLLIWFTTQNGIVFLERMGQFGNTGIVGYRWPESQIFFKDVGYEWLWGRGIGGGFNLRGTFNMAAFVNDSNWQVLHFGWFTFLLKGGIPFLLITLSFWFAGLGRNNISWLENKYNIVAKFWCPILFVIWSANPLALNFSQAITEGITFLLLARFGMRKKRFNLKG